MNKILPSAIIRQLHDIYFFHAARFECSFAIDSTRESTISTMNFVLFYFTCFICNFLTSYAYNCTFIFRVANFQWRKSLMHQFPCFNRFNVSFLLSARCCFVCFCFFFFFFFSSLNSHHTMYYSVTPLCKRFH